MTRNLISRVPPYTPSSKRNLYSKIIDKSDAVYFFHVSNNSLKYVAMKGISASCALMSASKRIQDRSVSFRSGLVDSDCLSGEWRYHINLQVS